MIISHNWVRVVFYPHRDDKAPEIIAWLQTQVTGLEYFNKGSVVIAILPTEVFEIFRRTFDLPYSTP